VRQLSFTALDDAAHLLPAALGRAPAHCTRSAMASGETPVQLIHDAANAIASGRATLAIVTGGEALRTAARRGILELFSGSKASASVYRHRYGLITPADIYPLYENAIRPAYGQSLAAAQAETGLIWSLMSQVAAKNPGAWLRKVKSPDQIMTSDADNRLISFPYTKLMVANASVNQSAAVIVTSLAKARALNVPAQSIVFIGHGAAAHESEEPLTRARFDESPGMSTTLLRAMQLNALEIGDLDFVELYSCFPCVPKMARRVLGWPEDRPVTVHGGLTFGGGPMGNYMTHAAVRMVQALRHSGKNGLLFANGGHCTHNHALLLTRDQTRAGIFPQDYDFQSDADRLRGPIPELTDMFEGETLLETYMVNYDRTGKPTYGAVLSRDSHGRRIIARAELESPAEIAFFTGGKIEPVGMRGTTRMHGDILKWSPAPD
jgi:acetyl-CoA C-acetyltransferase